TGDASITHRHGNRVAAQSLIVEHASSPSEGEDYTAPVVQSVHCEQDPHSLGQLRHVQRLLLGVGIYSLPPLTYLRLSDKIFTMSRRSASRRLVVCFMNSSFRRTFEQPTCHSVELADRTPSDRRRASTRRTVNRSWNHITTYHEA